MTRRSWHRVAACLVVTGLLAACARNEPVAEQPDSTPTTQDAGTAGSPPAKQQDTSTKPVSSAASKKPADSSTAPPEAMYYGQNEPGDPTEEESARDNAHEFVTDWGISMNSTDISDGVLVTATVRLNYRIGSTSTVLFVSDGDLYPSQLPPDCKRVPDGVSCFVSLLGSTGAPSTDLAMVFPSTATRVVATVTPQPGIAETNPTDNTTTLNLA